jgi:hypothetical protein
MSRSFFGWREMQLLRWSGEGFRIVHWFLCCTYFVALESVVKHWLVGLRFGGNSIELKFDTFLERWEFVFLAEWEGQRFWLGRGTKEWELLERLSFKEVLRWLLIELEKHWLEIWSRFLLALLRQYPRFRSKLWRLERRKIKAWLCKSCFVAGLSLSLIVLFWVCESW